ncbi:hypothetical protein SAMN04488005_1534 [Yoonia tamlensis]|uniref:Uncharacterized protein n=1 Tax=Yoonia tamlensis TaxID=390270 RepID=A0A1I6GEN6_9RHOB|nr:hypothetical protein [Yoonia tamlensis]SFR40649.1 hypothetical protein SAMN04488005_1534 [Yoonia tamlensis]
MITEPAFILFALNLKNTTELSAIVEKDAPKKRTTKRKAKASK